MSASFRKPREGEMEIVSAVRAGLKANGFDVVLCNEGMKGPAYGGWPDYSYDPDNPEPAIPRTKNADGAPTKLPHLGTGVKTSGIAAVDIDIEDKMLARSARIAFEEAAGVEPAFVRIRENSGKAMLIYPVTKNMPEVNASNGGKEMKFEVDANKRGQFAYLHGKHPSGVWLRYEGDQPWGEGMHLDTFTPLTPEALRAGYSAACARVGIEVKHWSSGGAASYSGGAGAVRGATQIAKHAIALLTGESVTPAAEELCRQLFFEYDANPHFVEVFVRALAEEGRKANPAHADRYENLLKQMDPRHQRIPLHISYERKWIDHVERMMEGQDYVERAEELEKRAKADLAVRRLSQASRDAQIASLVKAVNQLPADLLPQALEYINKKAGKS